MKSISVFTLFSKVLNDEPVDEETRALKNLNDFIRDDTRVDISMLTIGDGVTFCQKK